MSTKLDVLNSLSQICDQLIVGGGIANTFLAAAGHPVGKSLYEPDLLDTARAIAAKVSVPLPVDVVVAKEFAESATATVKLIADVAADDMILDIGPQTAANFAELLKSSKTILWNGPVGVFEFDQFGNGTKVLAQAIAQSAAFSIAGGGDTLAAIDKYGVAEQISYISTGGGAFSSSSRARCRRRSKSWKAGPKPEAPMARQGSVHMVKTLPLLIVAGLLAGCGSQPAQSEPDSAEPEKGCYQADWQAETAPVINKRMGPDGLDKYETPAKAKEHGCP